MARNEAGPAQFPGLMDLACDVTGGRVIIASDDFFAEKENLIKRDKPVFDPDAFTDRGKLMDGWESRRRRTPGHDWCIVKLGVPGHVRAVDIDTAWFLGNHPPFASLDGCNVDGDPSGEELRDEVEWTEIVPQVPLKLGSQNLCAVVESGPFTHVRLHMYPDGGVARLRVFGDPLPLEPPLDHQPVDLAGVNNGGTALACSDMFFAPMQNLLLPDQAANMGEGWETRRKRGPGSDWILLSLGAMGELDWLEIDTSHFKGNFPDRVSVEGICWPDAPPASLQSSPDWVTVLPETKMQAHHVFKFENELNERGPFTHLRVWVHPCGGISRFRAYGQPTPDAKEDDALLHKLHALDDAQLEATLLKVCGSRRWARAMLRRRPFTSRAALLGWAEAEWWRLGDKDWLEAFSHHPQIGANVDELREKYAATAEQSAAEQAGVQGASEETLAALAEGNRDYLAHFGYIFLVCATGKSADEMLTLLRSRLGNVPDDELRIAAGEQAKITRLRLLKLGT